MTILCKECSHSKVCKFEKDYQKFVDGLKENVPTPFSLKLECPHYQFSAYQNVYPRIDCLQVDGTSIKATDYNSSSTKGSIKTI